jgi:integrase
MASVYKRNGKGKYYAAWIGPDGKQKTVCTGTTDERAAKRIAAKYEAEAALRREGVIDATLERNAIESRRPLSEHVADYKAELESRQNTAKHVRMTIKHIETIIEHCKAESITDLTSAAVRRAIDATRKAGNSRVKRKGDRKPSSLRTCNAHLRSIKSFTAWLTDQERCQRDLLHGLKGFNAETDRRHVRRELTADELNYLLQHVGSYTTANHNLAGADREMAYRVALGTGLRAKELRSLTPESFDLGDEPTVTVAAAHSKRRRKDRQPIRADLAAMVKEWLADKPAGQQLFAELPGDTARMLRTDLARARAAWIAEAGDDTAERAEREKSDFLCYRNVAGEIADFHATRHTFVSALAASGAPVKTVQELARHSTPTLTFGVYAHARPADVSSALAALPGAECQTGQSSCSNRRSTQGTKKRETVRQDAMKAPLLDAAIGSAVSTEPDVACDVMRRDAPRDNQEALVGVEPTMADLQSAALATWLQRLRVPNPSLAMHLRSLREGNSAFLRLLSRLPRVAILPNQQSNRNADL